jgi:hypothetical protein
MHIAICTDPKATKIGQIPLSFSQSYALKVRAKLSMFLKIRRQVNASTVISAIDISKF